jgi:hypothetical protein
MAMTHEQWVAEEKLMPGANGFSALACSHLPMGPAVRLLR